MAISECHYRILKKLRDDGVLPECKSILNIGQPNWYGDMNPQEMFRDLPEAPCDLNKINMTSVAIADVCYRFLFGSKTVVSIDLGGDEGAIKADLNEPHAICNLSYDLVVNHGTAEHVFNVGQVFRTMHDNCRHGGYMIHEAPFTGWVDHGFYSLQPTLFYDVAAANGYELLFMALEVIDKKGIIVLHSRERIAEIVRLGGPPANSCLFVVLQKTRDEPFAIPMQGIYHGNVSEAVARAWHELR